MQLTRPGMNSPWLSFSISTEMTEGGSVLRTKPAGPGWWHITSSKVGPVAASPKLQRVCLKSTSLFDKVTPAELPV